MIDQWWILMEGSPVFFKERWVMDGDISFFVLVKGIVHYIMVYLILVILVALDMILGYPRSFNRHVKTRDKQVPCTNLSLQTYYIYI